MNRTNLAIFSVFLKKQFRFFFCNVAMKYWSSPCSCNINFINFILDDQCNIPTVQIWWISRPNVIFSKIHSIHFLQLLCGIICSHARQKQYWANLFHLFWAHLSLLLVFLLSTFYYHKCTSLLKLCFAKTDAITHCC